MKPLSATAASRRRAVIPLRIAALVLTAGLSLLGSYYFLRFTSSGGLTALDIIRVTLFGVSAFWLIWGAVPAVLGVIMPPPRMVRETSPPLGMTVVIVPIYNEDARTTFSRVAAMNRSLVQAGAASRFHFAILSDTTAPDVIGNEAIWYEHLMREPEATDRIFYRRRLRNIGKKAGNIEDFIVTSGGAYDYALILDADSLMEAEAMVAMASRLDREPDLGLLQTVPRVIRARSLFGRTMQFSSAYLSPLFARGASLLHGPDGPYWGHNAIVRVSAFAANCGLPELSGAPPYGGHILSHDYVEAALLARGGWRVEVDAGIEGSFEEGPDNLIAYAKRDRRWCQGNLQHRRILAAPGLKFWNRFTLLQGIMAYLASPIWLALLATSIAAAIIPGEAIFEGLLHEGDAIWGLALAVAAALLLPKFLIVARGLIDRRNRAFGGSFRAFSSIVCEIVFSTLLAPILLLYQTRAVAQVLLGRDGGWPATQRDDDRVSLSEAFTASWWIIIVAALTLLVTWFFARGILLWLLPVTLPALLAPFLIAFTSQPGRPGREPLVFQTAQERAPSPVITLQDQMLTRWEGVTVTTINPTAGVDTLHATA